MKIATWNVNGIRARQGQLLDWLAAEKPDIVCLQEIKASLDQLPFELRDVDNYWSYWHGEKGYSGVALLVAKSLVGALPVCSHPGFDFEQRIACATVPSPAGDVMIASVYVPNGGKDFDAKMRFLEALEALRRRCRTRRQAADSLRRSERRARRARHPSEAAQAQSDRRAAGRTRAARAHHLAWSRRRASLVRARQRQPVHVVGAVAQHEREEHRLADRLRAGLERARSAREVSDRAARDRQQRSRAGSRGV